MTAPAVPAIGDPSRRVTKGTKPPISLQRKRVWTIARTELKQLIEARDFWLPMMILGGIFFLVIPTILLIAITSIGDIHAVHQISQAVQLLPAKARAAVKGKSEQGQTAYALAVFLLAPVAVVVPPFVLLTLSVVLRLSARVKSTAAAQQASGLVTLPLIMIAYAEATGAVYGGNWVGIGVGAIVWFLALLGLWRGMKAVTRGRLLGVADGI